MRTLAEIESDIARVQAEMQDVHGTTTEVYARIVGYYRSVRNWNKGKREEYNHRKLFVADENRIAEYLPESATCDCTVQPVVRSDTKTDTPVSDEVAHYELYIRKTCPNCPPVKECCANLSISGEQIDVDSAEGFSRASTAGVFSAPTAIFFDAEGTEIARAHSVNEIHSLPALDRIAETVPAFA